ncbi:MAG: DUF3696 domain-containing protein [Deltaproteobacteria bacterium]|nr:DUF3696 domain-containing protein [Myxococcales bacterium]MDP3215576.1 DUF3696 domain-containing protein [Deltaproteobacteria bacterium]
MKIEGIKSFSEPTQIGLAPITIIAGTNSSGKSTIFQSILLLKQAVESPPTTLAGLYLNGRYASVGSYQDWSYKHQGNPVKITIALQDAKHAIQTLGAILPGTSFGNRRALHQSQWWTDSSYWGSFDGILAVKGRLTVELEGTPTSPNSAKLTAMEWTADLLRIDGKRIPYKFKLTTASEDERRDEIVALLPDGMNIDQFPFCLEFDPAIHVSRYGRQQVRVNRFRCTVEGLAPAHGLVPVGQPAEQQTIRTLLSVMIKRIGSYATLHPRAKHRSKRDPVRMLHSVPGTSDSRRFFDRAIRFVENAPDQMIAEHLIGHSAVLAIRLASDFSVSSPAAKKSAHALRLKYLSRLRYLLPAGSDGYEVDTEADSAFAEITDIHPQWSGIVGVARRYLSFETDVAMHAAARSLICQVAKESREHQRALLPLPAESWDRYSGLTDDEEKCPTELDASRFLKDFLFHLGPLRDEPRNLYASEPPQAAHDVGQRGERAINCLRWFGDEPVLVPAPDSFPIVVTEVSLYSAVVSWGRYLGIFGNLKVDTTTKYGTVCKIIGTEDDSEVQADLTNVGVGVSQLLPILVLCLAAPIGSTVLIEQPELHLHPSVQSQLATFFASCALSGRQIVIETHSEHLINRIRLIVAQGHLDNAEDVSVLFVERDGFGSSVRRVELRKDGGIDTWPRGFNDEAERTLKDILAIRMGGRVKS